MIHPLMAKVEETSLRREAFEFEIGDTVEVQVRFLEGDKERIHESKEGAPGEDDASLTRGVTRVVPIDDGHSDEQKPDEAGGCTDADNRKVFLSDVFFFLGGAWSPRLLFRRERHGRFCFAGRRSFRLGGIFLCRGGLHLPGGGIS